MATNKPSKAQAKRDALAAWWRRLYWPAVILSADPGAKAGASLIVSEPDGLDVVDVAAIKTDSLDLEAFVDVGIDTAKRVGLPLVLVVETWSAGGTRGIDQWLGLGAARGAWIRAYKLAIAHEKKFRANGVNLFTSRIARALVSKWRSKMIEESGTRDAAGKWTRYDSDGWKDAAFEAVKTHFPDEGVIESPDAAESLLQGAYAARSDVVGKLLPKTLLARYGLKFPPVDPGVKMRTRKKRKR